MKSISKTLITFLIFSLSVCIAQKRERPATKHSQAENDVVGIKCPGGELNQPRPEVIKLRLGDITRKALVLPKPEYPQNAKAAGIKGKVKTDVVVEITSGRVVRARTLSGNPFLQAAVGKVVCKVRFPASAIDGPPMRAAGIITYTFGNP
jgi:outer membrane biosynthesis protein TonB